MIDVRDQDGPGGFVDTDQAIPEKVLYGTVGYGTVGWPWAFPAKVEWE